MWVMHSQVRHRPWCLTFRIGQLPIAQISFDNKRPYLYAMDVRVGPFDSVAAAMTHMHAMLNSPPVDIGGQNGDDRTN